VTEIGYFILGFIVVFFGGLYLLGYNELLKFWDEEE
tara:strand:- start:171 stop:278 length:108 start_codon:yes stop_codon:yes gene_type:complete